MKSLFILIAAMAMQGSVTTGKAAQSFPALKGNNSTQVTLDAKNYQKMQCGNFTFCTPISRAPQAGEKVNVTVNYDCSSNFRPIGISIYNKESGMFQVDYDGSTKSVTQSIPKGTYDMFASYMSQYSELYYVFKEQVVIDADASFTLPQSEAQTPFSIKTVDHNGNALHMPVYNTSYQIVEPGTAEDYSSLSFFILKGYGNVAAIIGGGYKYQGHETDFYINKLSNRYMLCEARVISVGEVYWFNRYVINDFQEGKTITNDPTRFYKYEQKFEVTPKWKDSSDYHVPGYSMAGVYNGDAIIGQQSYIPSMPTTDYTTKFYLDIPKDDDTSADQFNVIVKPLMGDYMTKESYSPGDTIKDFYFIRGQQVVGDKDGLHFVAAGYEENGGFNSPEGSVRSRFYPGNPAFSFTPSTAKNSVYGASCPINSVRVTSYVDEGQEQNNVSVSYVGRYGELRDPDYFVIEQEEKQVTQDVYSMIIKNKNVKVDGLDGMNETKLVMIQNQADHVPPTLQMLQFKDKEGNVTDRFKDPRDGFIELAGGDFTYHYVPQAYSGYFTCAPVKVQALYYPHGETSQKKLLKLKEVPENYFMPGFGHFYRGSLENVPMSSAKQWYDVEITLYDNSENNQQQVISPAFCITGEQSGCTAIEQPQERVIVADGKIMVQSENKVKIALYSIDGRMVAASGNGEVPVGNLPHGVYIVKVLNQAGNGATQKITI